MSNNIKKGVIISILAIISIFLLITSCSTPSGGSSGGSDGGGGTTGGGTPSVAVTGIDLLKSTTYITVGGTETLYAVITPSDATNQNVTWTSSNTNVSVNSSGGMTGDTAGTADITVTTEDGGFFASCSVTVASSATAVTGIALNKATTTIASGDTERLTATITPGDATNQKISWSTSNAVVASVNTSGLITANSGGTADITVNANDTTNGTLTAICTVTVTDTIAPANVTGLIATPDDGKITLSWTEPVDADFKEVEITSLPVTSTVTVTKGTTTKEITGLTNGTSYTFTVKSVDTSGNKSDGASESATPADLTSPSVGFAPNGNATAAKSQLTVVTVTDAHSLASGYPKYQWGTSETVEPSGTWTDFTSGDTITQATGTGNYYLWIWAVDDSSNTTKTASSAFALDNTAPAEVSDLEAIACNAKVSLSWSEPADSDFAEVEITSIPVTSTVTVVKGTTSTMITGLTNGTAYTFRVKTVDTLGNKSTGEDIIETPAAPITFSPTNGTLDSNAELIAGTPGSTKTINAVINNDGVLYIATESNYHLSNNNDVSLIIWLGELGGTALHPWWKTGNIIDTLTDQELIFLVEEGLNGYCGWYYDDSPDFVDLSKVTSSSNSSGEYMEGTINLIGVFSEFSSINDLPEYIYFAVVEHGTNDGDPLIPGSQVPATVNSDGNIDSTEIIAVRVKDIIK